MRGCEIPTGSVLPNPGYKDPGLTQAPADVSHPSQRDGLHRSNVPFHAVWRGFSVKLLEPLAC